MTTFEQLDSNRQRRIIDVCRAFEELRTNDSLSAMQSLIEQVPGDDRVMALLELVGIDVELRSARGEEVAIDDYVGVFPEHAASIATTVRQTLATTNSPTLPAVVPERLGDFRVVRSIGRGGMGIVYEAIQESLQRRVALKILPRHPWLADAARQRFEREAKAIARLHHGHIVDIHGMGEQAGVLYFSMQLIDGEGLNRVIERLRAEQSDEADAHSTDVGWGETGIDHAGPRASLSDVSRRFETALAAFDELEDAGGAAPDAAAPARVREDGGRSVAPRRTWPWPHDGRRPGTREADEHCRFVARVGQQIAEALHYAHGEGVLHRDVKPSNIMLDEREQAWLTDFGLAKLLREETGEHLTEHDNVVGTLRYMAPENLQGQADARSDVYSLGLTLYELLTLRPPFGACGHEELLHRRLTTDAPTLAARPGLPRDLVTIVQKAIDREPASRYQTAGEMADDLRRFLDDTPIRARRVTAAERFVRWARRNRALASLLVTTAGLLVIGTVASLLAADHFRRLESEHRALSQERLTLAQHNRELAEKNRGMFDKARAERDRETLAVADASTQQGLRAVADGQHREALLWFAHAAARSEPLDAERARQSVVRYQQLRSSMARPVALLPSTAPVERMAVHPSGEFVLLRPFQRIRPVLWRIATRQPVAWPAELGPVFSMAWSPDGEWLAVGGAGRVAVWPFPACLESGDCEPRLIDIQPAPARQIEFDPTGRLLAIADDSAVRIWDLRTARFVRPPLRHDAEINGIEFDATGRRLATYGGNQFRVFELSRSDEAITANAAPLASGSHNVFPGWTSRAPRFIRNGAALLTTPHISQLQVWDLERKTPEQPFEARAIYCFEPLAPDLFLVGGDRFPGAGGWLVVSFAEPNQPQVRQLSSPPVADCLTAAYCRATDRLFIGCQFGENQLWSVRQQRPEFCSATVATGCTASAWSANGRWLATSDYSYRIVLWEFASPPVSVDAADPDAPYRNTENHFAICLGPGIHQCAFSADAQFLAVNEAGARTCVYDLTTVARVATLPLPEGTVGGGAVKPYFLADSARLAVDVAVHNALRRLEVWDWRKGELLQSFDMPIARGMSPFLPQLRQTPDRRHLVAPGNAAALRFTANADGSLAVERIPLTSPLDRIGISPDGRLIAGQSQHRPEFAEQYAIGADGAARNLAFSHTNAVRGAFYSNDSRRTATCSFDGTAKVWDTATGDLVAGPFRHPWWVYAAEFSPDDRHLLTYGKHATVSVWNLADGSLAASFAGQRDVVARFRPGREQVLIADAFGWFHVWDWRSSVQLWPALRLFTTTEDAWPLERTLTVSPDGRFAAVGGSGAIHLIDLTPLDARESIPAAELFAEAELLSGRRLLPNGQPAKLTWDEWHERLSTRLPVLPPVGSPGR